MRRSAAWRYLLVGLVGGGGVACGLGVVASRAGESGEDAATGVPQDAVSASATGADAADARVEQDSSCVPAVVIDDPLTTISVLTWQTYSSQADDPAAQDPGTGTLMAAINATMQPSQNAGLWLRQAVPTTAFDVSFDYLNPLQGRRVLRRRARRRLARHDRRRRAGEGRTRQGAGNPEASRRRSGHQARRQVERPGPGRGYVPHAHRARHGRWHLGQDADDDAPR